MNTSNNWIEAYIGLGSNLDNPVEQVRSAARELAASADIEKQALSPLYTSHPVGPQDQPDYVNAVMRILTRLAPLELLKQCQHIENQHGRVRLVRWGARTLDLDILLYGDQRITLPDLVIPHPELTRRAFVLYPLADIAPANLSIAGQGSLASLLTACPAEGLHRIVP
ncbi:2-amino-4-hydroxy-6-hydroxymethyldihydropteridine diphosphokinase [Methylomonas rapida]|uniref:2-amino-4-hydroxy-6-hydroxymethyldihydropteridine pyrophosphokinase n=1 Tax=Methylomonas rapida TaxID=2963939 RepID=A0ABY7GKV0_9GAMM|nr:2-amino-4-hydroxy-6-hydroxymethyldihydropteridine diphosphokinase [Methylomonas rapida]WAR45136.1 2-amino-4-hydroxy-6-hydroxymethyldihydropteridine diphosphokinase [Methylomonas rapida]